jgi:hypothetical protein
MNTSEPAPLRLLSGTDADAEAGLCVDGVCVVPQPEPADED